MVMLRAITISQTIASAILNIAMKKIVLCSAPVESAYSASPIHDEIG